MMNETQGILSPLIRLNYLCKPASSVQSVFQSFTIHSSRFIIHFQSAQSVFRIFEIDHFGSIRKMAATSSFGLRRI